MSFLAPLFLVGFAALAIPILVHLIQRERKDVIEFPSLMFLRRIPYQSVERRRIHNWLLLLLRAAAMILLVAAFARPFFHRDPVRAAAALSGAREVVILLDRSASMGYDDRWARARAAAAEVIDGLDGEDRATLVLFGTGAEEAVRSTTDRGTLRAALADAAVSSDATRFGPALRLAQSLLARSSLPRREAVLITDLQRTGWERHEEIALPEGAVLTPVSVAGPDVSDVAVTTAAFQRASFAGEERVTVTAGLTNRGAAAAENLQVRLEVEGRVVDTRRVSLKPGTTGSVAFPPFTVAASHVRGTIHAGADRWAANNVFHFVLSPSRPVSVLVIQGEGTAARASLFLTTALGIGTAPPFRADVVPVSRVTAEHFARRSVVVLNDATALPAAVNDVLARFVEQGGGLFVALGERSPWAGGESPLLPGRLRGTVDRGAARATLGFLDHSHPVFELFKQPRSGDFRAARFYRYRVLEPAGTDHVLARFDDGAAAMVERRVGAGRVIAYTSSIDDAWNDFPKTPMFLPFVHELTRHLAQYAEPPAWHTVGHQLDLAAPVSALVREGALGGGEAAGRRAAGIVLAPSGAQRAIGEGGAAVVELAEQGFYTVRLQGTGERRPYAAAVNLDPAESDLTPIAPQEFLASATGRAAVTASGESLERPDLTPADLEKRQSVWWFLLAAGAVALVSEAGLSNRLSGRFGRGLAPGAAARGE